MLTRLCPQIAVLLDEYDAIINNNIDISGEVVDFSPGVRSSSDFFSRFKTLLDNRTIAIAFFVGSTPITIKLFGCGSGWLVDHTRALNFAYVCGLLDSDVDAGLRAALKRHCVGSALGDRVKTERQKMKQAFGGYRFAAQTESATLPLETVYNSTCATHYMSTLSSDGVFWSKYLVPPSISLSAHAAQILAAVPDLPLLLQDLLLKEHSANMGSGYVEDACIPRGSSGCRDMSAALLFYYGVATLAPSAGPSSLEFPNEAITVQFLAHIHAISELWHV